jgi:uncharacterized protein (DUF433 family)
MPLTIHPDAPPLRIDDAGAVRVSKTRVLFVLVVREFQNGATPEQIVEAYDTLDLADVYAVIAYYLRHKAEVEDYLVEYDRAGDEIRKKIEAYQASRPELQAKADELKDRIAAGRAAAEAAGPR